MEKAAKKSKSVRAVPEGFQTVTPYLIVDEAEMLLEFIKKAFDGKVTFITKSDDDKVMHATVKIGDSTIMISDAMDGMEPERTMLYLYVKDVDAMYKKALQANATSIQEPRNEFYGDRAGAVRDAWDNKWWIATHVEDVDAKELDRRKNDAMREHREKNQEAHV